MHIPVVGTSRTSEDGSWSNIDHIKLNNYLDTKTKNNLDFFLPWQMFCALQVVLFRGCFCNRIEDKFKQAQQFISFTMQFKSFIQSLLLLFIENIVQYHVCRMQKGGNIFS